MPVFFFMMWLTILCLQPGSGKLCADYLKSTSGNIFFDTNNDGTNDNILRGGNLGIGTLTPSANLQIQGNAVVSTGSVGIGTSAPKSSFEISGALGFSSQTLAANATLGSNTLVFANSSSANLELSLPYAGNVLGRVYTIKKTSNSKSVWVNGGGNYIDDSRCKEMTTYDSGYPAMTVHSDGKQWYIQNKSGGVAELGASSGNLVGWWKLDETSGSSTAVDSSSRGYNGTYTLMASGNIGIPGKIGLACDVDGSNDCVAMADQDAFSPSVDPVTITMWVNVPSNAPALGAGTAGAAGSNFIGKGNTSNYEWAIENDSNTKIYFLTFLSDGSDVHLYVEKAMTVNDNTWHHYVMTVKKSEKMEAFIDGASVGTDTTVTGSLGNGTAQLWLGRTSLVCEMLFWQLGQG